jgi:hypothetical protein
VAIVQRTAIKGKTLQDNFKYFIGYDTAFYPHVGNMAQRRD